MKVYTRMLAVLAIMGWAVTANASLLISNWNLTADSLTFDLVGTVDVVGALDQDSFFIGPANSTSVDWINGWFHSTFTVNGGTYNATQGSVFSNAPVGEYLYTNAGGVPIILGDTVDLSFDFSQVGGFNPSALNSDDLIVSAGYNSGYTSLPDVSAQTGGIGETVQGTVPAPATIALLAVGLAGLVLSRRKKV
jgi:PEP-CTERM motif